MKSRRELYKSKIEDLSKSDLERYQLMIDQLTQISCELAGLSILMSDLDSRSGKGIDSAVKQLHNVAYRADSVTRELAVEGMTK